MYNVEASLSATLRGHQNPIFAIENSHDPRYIFTAGNDKGIVEWDVVEGKFSRILCAVPASVYCLHQIPGSSLLAVGMRNGEVWIVEPATQKLVARLQVEKGAVFALQTILSKRELIAVGEEGYAYVWSLDGFQLLYRFKISDTTLRTLAFLSGQAQVVFGDKNGYLHVYDAAEYTLIQQQHIHTLPVTALLANETVLFSGGRDAQLYKLAQQNLSTIQQITPHLFTVYAIVAHPHLPLLATVSRDKTIKIWDAVTLSLLKNIGLDRGYDSHSLSINSGLWNPLKNQLITVSDDKLVKIWDVTLS